MSKFQLSDSIPTGSWCLYYHNPADTTWTPESYQNLATVKTWGDFFTVIRELQDSSLPYGMFFWMREGIPPLYENYANIKGGCYSLRVNRLKASHFFMIYTLATMMGNVVNNSSVNQIQGISISPKRIVEKNQYFNVIKIWNKDCTKFNSVDQLIRLDNIHQHSDIIYTPHIEKKL